MTSTISSPSAKATPKTAAKPDSSGTPPEEIESESETISSGSTTWNLEMEDGSKKKLMVAGNTGWFTLGSGPRGGYGEARFYARASDKHYVALIKGVGSVYRDDVVTLISMPAPTITWPLGTLGKAAKLRHHEVEELASRIVAGVTGKDEDEPEVAPF